MDEEPLEIRTELIEREAMSSDGQIKTKKEGRMEIRAAMLDWEDSPTCVY